MVISIKVEGIENVQRFLKEKSKEIVNKTQGAIMQSGFYIQAEVQESIARGKNAPKAFDTGNLARSVKAEKGDKPLTSVVSTNVGYAKFIEYGTTKMAERPHFRNTAKLNQQKVSDFIKKAIK